MHFNPELQAKVDRLAAANNSSTDDYVQELVERYVDHDSWFREEVRKGLEQLDRGECLTHEEVRARIMRMFQP